MIKKTTLLIGLITSIFLTVNAQNYDKLLKLDPNVKTGKLDNGLTYFIRHQSEPKNRVELRLVINAGSICEDDDQQGLAHFIEHMCFNGSKHFEKNELIDFLESTGVKFGAHLNAYTSFDETVYQLQMPTDREGLIDSALLVLEDWGQNVSFSPEEIDKERGVVKEEWRLGLGAQERMMNETFPVLLKDSRYAVRLPIGKMDIIDTAHYSTITRFYNDWYRPDLMAVIVVGDIDVDKMEQKVIDHFKGFQNPENERPRIEYDIPENKKPLIAIGTDQEATYLMANVFYKHPKEIKTTVGDYRMLLKENLYNSMINARLSEIMQKPESPFMYAYAGYGGFLARTTDAYTSTALAKDNKIGESLKVMLEENERVKRFGFTGTEFERQKTDLLRGYEKSYNERDKIKSGALVNEYLQYFLTKEPAPGIETEYELAKQLLPTIKLEEINNLAKEWVTDENMVVWITAPEKDNVKVPAEDEVLSIIEAVKTTDLVAYEDKVLDEPLIGEDITPGKVVEETETEEGYTKWVLSNNVEVYIKTTDFKNDEILFKGYSTGGTSLIPDDKIATTLAFNSVINESGLGNFSNIDLEKKLSGKIVSLSASLTPLRQEFKGHASPQDIETLLQLQYLYFTNPRKDSEAFKKVIDNQLNQAKFSAANPQMAFFDTLASVTSSNSPRTIVIPTEEQIKSIEQDYIYDVYKKQFQHADGFRFFFVGNVDKEQLKPFVEKYLASLPVSGEELKWKDRTPEFPGGITSFTYHKGKEPQSMVVISMKGDYKYNFENNLIFNTLEKTLSINLREKLREEESGTYGVWVQKNYQKYPRENYSLTIAFGCAPENVDKLVNATFDEIKKIQNNGPGDKVLNKAKETFIRERESAVRENSYWLGKLDNVTFLGSKIIPVDEYNKAVNAVTSEQVKEAAGRYITLDHYVSGVLKPETE
jgi:zinc protease